MFSERRTYVTPILAIRQFTNLSVKYVITDDHLGRKKVKEKTVLFSFLLLQKVIKGFLLLQKICKMISTSK